MNLKKVNLYIPIEIKHREFLSQLLLSSFAIKAGFRVYIGSKGSINRLIERKSHKGGIFFYKGGVYLDRLYQIKKKCDHFVILDQELGTEKKTYAEYLRKRLLPDTDKLVDRYYVIGKYGYDVTCKTFPAMKDYTICTGWPRVDLWRKENDYLFKEKTESILKKYGNFMLFSSDFGYNSKKIIDDRIGYIKKTKNKLILKSLPWEKNRAEKSYKEYNQFLKLLEDYDKLKDCPLIIIRPHPAEDIDAWFEFSKKLKNIKIIYKDEITPWINASSGLIHRGCTSAIQAHMRGLPIGYFAIDKLLIHDLTLTSILISEHLFTLSDLVRFCKNSISSETIMKPIRYHDELKKMVHIENDKLASELIIEDLLKLKSNKEYNYQVSFRDTIIDILLSIRSSLKKFIKDFFKIQDYLGIAPQSRKMPGGISKNEVEEFLKLINHNQDFKTNELFKDCIEITKCTINEGSKKK